MKLLTEDAVLRCDHHAGVVKVHVTQDFVTVNGRRVLVEPNPEACRIDGCTNLGLGIKPCQLTFKVREGYSDFLRIGKTPICLDTVQGLTDGTPPGVVHYTVDDPGQQWVDQI
jgi:hypothetical protein